MPMHRRTPLASNDRSERLRLRPTLALLVAAASLGALAACESPDPDGRFDEFVQARNAAADTGADVPTDVPTDTPAPSDVDPDAFECPPEPLDPTGDWYLIVSAVLDRSKPFYIRTTFEPEDGGTWNVTFQPLKADVAFDDDFNEIPREDRRTPVGEPIVVSGVVIDEAGSFAVSVDGLVLEDESNPVTGRLVRGNVSLTGSFRDLTTSCGDVGGQIVEPLTLNLNGSTFTLFRSDDFNAVEDIPINCAQLPAPVPAPPQDDCERPEGPTCDDFDPAGTYFLAVSSVLDRTKPLFLTLTVTPDGANYTFVFQPLASDTAFDDDFNEVPRDDNRVPVGDPITTSGVAINATTGAFEVLAANLIVDGEANPVTGRLIRGDVSLNGSFRDLDGACGAVGGQIVEPLTLNLNGSTFAFVRTDDPLSVDPVAYNCDQLVVGECTL